jgi:transcriptional regulator with XRE-family HTH domain
LTNFGKWVRTQRKDQKRTQTACAELAGMSLQSWNRIERNTKHPTLSTINAIARGLSIPPQELLAAYQPDVHAPMDVPIQAELEQLSAVIPLAKRPKFWRLVRQSAETVQAAMMVDTA